MGIVMKAIGVIHTPLFTKSEAPIQSSRSDVVGTAELFPQYLEGLDGIEDFSHIFLIYEFHLSEPGTNLKVKPFLDDQMHGVFATRYPSRPNPLGFSVVHLIERKGDILRFRGADILDGTPLLDIKPYIPEFDIFTVDKIGWYQHRKHP
jgi:tRNA (adenine37-N6)-methyltransferase